MRNIQLSYSGPGLSYEHARQLAHEAARKEKMLEPTIMAWHEQATQAISPRFDGGNPEAWWGKYGEGNGGRLEIDVAHLYQFVMMDTRGFETVGPMPVRNLRDGGGTEYVCMSSMLGDSDTPNRQACMPLDDWWADQY
jgi:hypothetical protein